MSVTAPQSDILLFDPPELFKRLREACKHWKLAGNTDEIEGAPLGHALDLHATNFTLWALEDAVRDELALDSEIVRLKREIDTQNLKRNDLIDDLDECVAKELVRLEINPDESIPPVIESPGAVVDRLSVMALRVEMFDFYLKNSGEVDRWLHKKQAAKVQANYLTLAAVGYVDDLLEGWKRLVVSRNLKCYGPSTAESK